MTDEPRPVLRYTPPLAIHAGLVGTAAVLIVGIVALAVKTRQFRVNGLLAAALVCHAVSNVGMLALRTAPTSSRAAAAALLGTLLGTTITCGAICTVMPVIREECAEYESGKVKRVWRAIFTWSLCGGVMLVAAAETVGAAAAGTKDYVSLI